MPAIAPSYIYNFFALITVASILISSFAAYTTTLRNIPATKQLENLLNHVAAKGYELIALTTAANATSVTVLRLPSTIGDRRYWVRLRNEPSKAFVEGALESIHEGSPCSRVYLPKTVSVVGNYSSEYGPAVLECYTANSTITLQLSCWRGKV